jgi:hypothetical protein
VLVAQIYATEAFRQHRLRRTCSTPDGERRGQIPFIAGPFCGLDVRPHDGLCRGRIAPCEIFGDDERAEPIRRDFASRGVDDTHEALIAQVEQRDGFHNSIDVAGGDGRILILRLEVEELSIALS